MIRSQSGTRYHSSRLGLFYRARARGFKSPLYACVPSVCAEFKTEKKVAIAVVKDVPVTEYPL